MASDKSTRDIQPVTNIDLTRYTGRWYEIARLPVIFENELDHVTATYSLKENGRIEVLNEGLRKGKLQSVKGNASVEDPKVPAKLFVSFFLWFGSDYIVFDLDPEYRYAMVTGSTKDYLWILSRTPSMDDKIYSNLLDEAKNKGFETSNLIFVDQK